MSKFSLDLLRTVSETNSGNIFLSPVSILAAMSVATAATDGDTESELKTALGLDGDYNSCHRANGDNLRQLVGDGLTIANRIWINESIPLHEAYRTFISDVYDVKVSDVDTSDSAGEAARINRWVEKATNEKIHEIINPGMINPDLVAIITNAIAYQGNWIEKFDPEDTFPGNWKLDDGSAVLVDMMNKYSDCRAPYIKTKTYSGISLKLDGDVSMAIILPNADTSCDSVLSGLETKDILAVVDGYTRDVMVSIPKWTVETEYKLIPTFQAMGVSKAFGGGDFSRMSGESIFISDIVHKAFVRVNEEGAEMAAATAVVATLECMVASPPHFKADRPFLYFAVKNGEILFAGRLSDPR